MMESKETAKRVYKELMQATADLVKKQIVSPEQRKFFLDNTMRQIVSFQDGGDNKENIAWLDEYVEALSSLNRPWLLPFVVWYTHRTGLSVLTEDPTAERSTSDGEGSFYITGDDIEAIIDIYNVGPTIAEKLRSVSPDFDPSFEPRQECSEFEQDGAFDKKAWRQFMLQWHPDKCTHSDKGYCEEMTKYANYCRDRSSK